MAFCSFERQRLSSNALTGNGQVKRKPVAPSSSLNSVWRFISRRIIEEVHTHAGFSIPAQPIYVCREPCEGPFCFLPRDKHFRHLQTHFYLFSHLELAFGREVSPTNRYIHGFNALLPLRLLPDAAYPHGHAHDKAFRLAAFCAPYLFPFGI